MFCLESIPSMEIFREVNCLPIFCCLNVHLRRLGRLALHDHVLGCSQVLQLCGWFFSCENLIAELVSD
jgi:hypothetical protein